MNIKLLTKNYKGVFISIGKYWKGIYIHFPKKTYRLYISDNKLQYDTYNTELFNSLNKNEMPFSKRQ